MTTTIQENQRVSNYLMHKITTKDEDGNKMIVTIRLDDDCKNGHNDFSITGNVYKDGKFISGGCIHDEILKVLPELKIFVDLHLSDAKGVPMYAIEKSYYYLSKEGIKTMQDYLRVTDEQAQILATAEDSKHLQYLVDTLNIPAQWQKEADKAIAILEEITGMKFEDNGRPTYLRLPDTTMKQIENKIKLGYYSTENKQKREEEKKEKELNITIANLQKERDKDIAKATNKCNINIAVLNTGLSIESFIYYNHTNEGVFNWKNYGKKVTDAEFSEFLNKVNYTGLPEGITFKIFKLGK